MYESLAKLSEASEREHYLFSQGVASAPSVPSTGSGFYDVVSTNPPAGLRAGAQLLRTLTGGCGVPCTRAARFPFSLPSSLHQKEDTRARVGSDVRKLD